MTVDIPKGGLAGMENYIAKNDWLLAKGYAEVSPYDFYRDIFPIGSFERLGEYGDKKPNGIMVNLSDAKRPRRMMVTDDLESLMYLEDCPFAITSPISYFGRHRDSQSARYLYALCFDLDGVEIPQLGNLLHQMQNNLLPQANYIVNSGNGVHVYYLFNEPVPLYPDNQKYLRTLKYLLTNEIWNKYTSNIQDKQMQGVLQGFRIVGSQTKFGAGYLVRAFRISDKRVTLGDLASHFDPKLYPEMQEVLKRITHLSMEQVKKKYPEWYERRVVQGLPRKRWAVNRAVYDYWKKQINSRIKTGHRYFGIMTLAIYAKKCSVYDPKHNPNPVTEEELRRDAYELLAPFDALAKDGNHFTEDDVEAALHMFLDDYVTFPRRDIARITAISIEPKNRRNGRKQTLHLRRARAVQEIEDEDGRWRNVSGRPKAKVDIIMWRFHHPNGTKAECHRETGFDLKTIRKWWGETEQKIPTGRPSGRTAKERVGEWRVAHPNGTKAECHRDTGFDPKTIRKWWEQ